MNRVRPSRRRWYSSATGSLTFMTMSDSPHTSSASSRIVAPCETYSSSVIEEPSPAPFCDEHVVTAADELVDTHRGDADAELVVLDLAGDTDLHGYLAQSDSSDPAAPLPQAAAPRWSAMRV